MEKTEHNLYNEYGPTEATVAISAYKVTCKNVADLDANVPIGTTGTNMNVVVLDEHEKPVEAEGAGELYIGGKCLARGYINRQELTEQKFLHKSAHVRLYKTGDLCRQRSNGIIEYLGRIDDQVKIRGFRIEPGEIEKHLATYHALKTVAVVAQKDHLNEQNLIAYYIVKNLDCVPSAKQLREFLKQYVPEYMIPTAFVQLQTLPLTANGKLDKNALPSPRLAATQNYIKPKTALEKKLVSMWAEELNNSVIGINDNFFELGGHSLSAARLVSKISHELKKNITLHDFYKAACIKELALIVKKTKKNPEEEKYSSNYRI